MVPNGEIKYDTIHCSNEAVKVKVDIDSVYNIKHTDKLALLKTKGQGTSFWIGEVLYQKKTTNKILLLCTNPSSEKVFLLYYNGDSLLSEALSINKPIIKKNNFTEFDVLNIIDSSDNNGFQIKSILFYQISKQLDLLERKSFFPQKKVGEKNYDFDITVYSYTDSFLVKKNKVNQFKWW